MLGEMALGHPGQRRMSVSSKGFQISCLAKSDHEISPFLLLENPQFIPTHDQLVAS